MNFLKFKIFIFYLATLLVLLSLASLTTITSTIEKSKITNDTPFSPIYGTTLHGMAVELPMYGSNIYASNTDSFFVSKFDTSGNFVNQHFIYLNDHPTTLACSKEGALYVGKNNGGVNKYTFTGGTIALDFISDIKATVILPAYGILYVADIENQRIGKYSSLNGYAINPNYITNVNAIALEILENKLFVATGLENKIRIYNRETGDLIDSNIAAGFNIRGTNSLFISDDSSLFFDSYNDSVQLINDTLETVGFNKKLFKFKEINGENKIDLFLSTYEKFQPDLFWHPDCKYCNRSGWEYEIPIGKRPNCKILVVYSWKHHYNRTGDPNLFCPDNHNCGSIPYVGQRIKYCPDSTTMNCPCQSDDWPLPVELSSFTAAVNSRDVKLTWNTSSELNNNGYEIQRSFANSDFTKIGFVKGKGTVNAPSDYSFEDKNLSTGRYYYRLKQIDFNGNFKFYDLSNEVVIGVPNKFSLLQNYPNPFNPVTKIRYDIPLSGNVSMKIYDNIGREVKSIINEFKDAGYYTVEFNGSNFASGIYYYKLETGNFTATKKMVLLK